MFCETYKLQRYLWIQLLIWVSLITVGGLKTAAIDLSFKNWN